MYGDFTTQVDDLFGEVTTTLERLGYARNTLVIFTSDNGPVWYPKDVERFGHRASHLDRGMKFDLWEGGHRMPFIARWPGRIPAGSVSDDLLSFTDLLSTFAAVLGRELPEGTGADSQNLLPVLLGAAEASPIRNTMVHYARQGDLAIRQGQWKLIPTADGGELYNLEEDIAETRNLYRERPEVVQRLRAALDNHRSRSTGLPQIPL
jgi:arylsulfatase A-like enzyme